MVEIGWRRGGCGEGGGSVKNRGSAAGRFGLGGGLENGSVYAGCCVPAVAHNDTAAWK